MKLTKKYSTVSTVMDFSEGTAFIDISELRIYVRKNSMINIKNSIDTLYISEFAFNVYRFFNLKYLGVYRKRVLLNTEIHSEKFITRYYLLKKHISDENLTKITRVSNDAFNFIKVSVEYLKHKKAKLDVLRKDKNLSPVEFLSANFKDCNKHEPDFISVLFDFLYRTGSFESQIICISFILNNTSMYFHSNNEVKYHNQLLERLQILESLLKNENEAVKETKNPLLIEGKAPNILERYTIANELLDIDTTISKLNITSEGKSILLAQIMGCSKQAARELLNGTYNGRAKIRTSTIDNYISNLKK